MRRFKRTKILRADPIRLTFLTFLTYLSFCDELKRAGHGDLIRRKTGLVIDAYFSGSKLRWLLEHVEGARERARRGELAFGTVDSWLLWNLTGGALHITDPSNASRTMLFNLRTGEWYDELLGL